MNYFTHSHFGGAEKVSKEIQDEIARAISSTKVVPSKGSASRLRDAILAELHAVGWSTEFPIAPSSAITITSTKSQVGLCLQTGNMARLYADLLKLQKVYIDSAITSAVMIVPAKPLAIVLGENIADADRLERELEIFGKVIHVPILLFALA